MADKQYVSVFVRKPTRDELKVRATKLGYPSLISLLEAVAELPLKTLETLKNSKKEA